MIAALDLSGQAAMRLGTQIVKIRFADKSSDATQQLSPRTRRAIVAIGYADDAWFEQVHQEIDAEVEDAYEFAKASAEPSLDELLTDVFAIEAGV